MLARERPKLVTTIYDVLVSFEVRFRFVNFILELVAICPLLRRVTTVHDELAAFVGVNSPKVENDEL